jgi:hypothetical protein
VFKQSLYAAFLLTAVPQARANNMSFTDVTFNWTGFTVTTTGGLVLDHIDEAPGSPFVNLPRGTGIISSLDNGMLAIATLAEANMNIFTSASLTRVFWFYGSGSGALHVEIPWTLTLGCNGSPDGGDTVVAQVTARLTAGPGLGNADGWSYGCNGTGAYSGSGVLVVDQNLDNPVFGPLVSFGFSTSSTTIAILPEPSSVVLLSVGLLAGAIGQSFRSWRSGSKLPTSPASALPTAPRSG